MDDSISPGYYGYPFIFTSPTALELVMDVLVKSSSDLPKIKPRLTMLAKVVLKSVSDINKEKFWPYSMQMSDENAV
jgi:hypothetical protein